MAIVRDIANFNGNLVWTRYNAHLVANSIVLGFIGHLVAPSPTVDQSRVVPMVACLFGLTLTALWWRITSAGWSLMHSWLSVMPANERPPENGYEKWKKVCNVQGRQDSIWWGAHLVILIFYVAYVLLLIYFAIDENGLLWPPLSVIVALSTVAVGLFGWLLWSSMRKFSLSRFDATKDEKTASGT